MAEWGIPTEEHIEANRLRCENSEPMKAFDWILGSGMMLLGLAVIAAFLYVTGPAWL